MNVELRDLGVKDYQSVWELQERLMEDVQNGGVNRLLFVEHPHVYTLGRNGHEDNMLHKPEDADLLRVNRGGDITYHGPGQLVVYTIFRLYDFGGDIRSFVHNLEEVVIRTIAHYGIKGDRIGKAAGVWLDTDTPAVRKICALGLRCSHAVTMHGFALNVNTDLDYFGNINPCGFTDKGVTSIAEETGCQIPMEDVKELIKQQFTDVFKISF
ncbi:MAG: lipoyl(octanoyl) transferase LipB [Tannerella sp.]|jgi:lipoyl(octanoyl) transferase|nr:lipoyl(octanoyl) transferase LipB [Tannerella sp.]